MTDILISKELYEAAGEAWARARARLDAANSAAAAAEDELHKAEAALAGQEAAPGIPAHWHSSVPADMCRIGSRCAVHGDGVGW